MVVHIKVYIDIKPRFNGNNSKFTEVFQFKILIGNGSSGRHWGGGCEGGCKTPNDFY